MLMLAYLLCVLAIGYISTINPGGNGTVHVYLEPD